MKRSGEIKVTGRNVQATIKISFSSRKGKLFLRESDEAYNLLHNTILAALANMSRGSHRIEVRK